MKKTDATPSSRAPRKAAAKPLRKASGGTPGPTGQLTSQERIPLILQSKKAFSNQQSLHRIEPGMAEDEWRRDMVMDCVGLEGISKINRSHWRQVMAKFYELAGDEDKAFELGMKTGTKSYRPVSAADTWETSETYVALIKSSLTDHKAAAVAHPKGHLHEGWFLAAARQRTGKPTLTMATLAERLDPATLEGLLSHLRNHIAVREGRDCPERRAKRSYPKPADPGEMDDPF